MVRGDIPRLANEPGAILDALGAGTKTVLLFGAPGSGKSTLAGRLAAKLAQRETPCHCLGADPGLPAFGPPGAVSLATWNHGNWQVRRHEALCTLDAGRFRLPLLTALQHLLTFRPALGLLLVDAPGVVRGVAGRELLAALCTLLERPDVLILAPADTPLPLPDELRALAGRLWRLPTAVEASRPGPRQRARQRTARWDAWLDNAESQTLDITTLPLLGSPPPADEPAAWEGRQIALLHRGHTLTLGEVVRRERHRLWLKLPPVETVPDALLVRDACRAPDGLLVSAEPFVDRQPITPVPLPSGAPGAPSPPLAGRCGPLDFTLINGVFGDPLLHLRLRHAGRSLLFDLGEASGLSARLAHQISDVFISHAHMDHLAGFQWLLRSRLGEFPHCRLFGPPGLARHIQGFLDSFLWDRIADRGPVFEVAEWHGETLRRWRLQAGRTDVEPLPSRSIREGVLLEAPGFRIRATLLDHHTPVLAFAFEPRQEIHVRKDRLTALGLPPGPWLGTLKQAILAERPETLVECPDGRRIDAATLAEELLLIRPGKRLVYATDLADTTANRERLIRLAHHAHTFFCESPFLETDRENARRNGHLTTRACAEIANAAGVGLLVPFHFSRRYQDRLPEIYEELQTFFPRILGP